MSKNKEAVAVKEESKPVSLYASQLSELDIEEAREAMESFQDENIGFPVVKWKDGEFLTSESADPEESIEGIIVYTKRSNVFYKSKFKGGNTPPDCFSPDGIKPSPSIEKPMHSDCATCPMNQFGSDGEAKSCKNTRPMFILTPGSIMPRVLRIPPTSLKTAKNYCRDMTADHMSFSNVITKFETFKKDEAQEYFNMKFKPVRKVTTEEKEWMRNIKGIWLSQMKEVNTGLDVEEEIIVNEEESSSAEGRAF